MGKKSGLIMRLYKLNQEELLESIKDELIRNGIEFKEDDYGNIWSFNHKDRPCFVAHCDTVIGNDALYKKRLVLKHNKLSRPGYILGADDRAGVNLILNHKYNINFILTKDEEAGGIGARFLSDNIDFIRDCDNITFFIELDRKGNDNIVGYKHGYCNMDLAEKIEQTIGFKDVYGVFTDIDLFTNISQGVNLSVGYYNAHTKNEYLDLKDFENINNMIIKLSKIKGFKDIADIPRFSYRHNYKFLSGGDYNGYLYSY